MDKSELWEDLLFEISSTKIVKFGNREDKVLLGVGNRSSKIMFIGDDPNLYEDGSGLTKEETSGDFFFKLCELVGLQKSEFYLTNIVKCNARLNELNDEEKNFYSDILNMEIAIVNPEVIISLGLEASKFLLNDENIKMDQVRGCIYEWKGGIKLMPVYDPYFLNKDIQKHKESPKWLTWQDMKNIKSNYGD